MTTRLYYTDASLQTFDAVVRACNMVDGRVHLVLDQTAFYPTSGGQPFDTGRIADRTVIEVFDNDAGDIVHVVDGPLAPGSGVQGQIDWPRRLDHMQQHTGQHVLSAAFDRLCGVRTTSFHLGTEASTIDLAREVSAAESGAAEGEANRVVWDDRPVQVRFASEEEASRLPLRKEPVRAGTLRLVEIQDFDLSACGGTHVARTGTIGLIAITHTERFKGATRVTFVCGGRALGSHGRLRDVVLGATRALSVPPDELVTAIDRTQTELKDASRRLRRMQDELSVYRAVDLCAGAETIGPYRVVLRPELELDAAGLKGLALAVVSGSGTIAVFVGPGTPTPVVIACSAGIDVNASSLLRETVATLGGRGGGSATMAQGGLTAPPDAVLDEVRNRLSGLASRSGS